MAAAIRIKAVRVGAIDIEAIRIKAVRIRAIGLSAIRIRACLQACRQSAVIVRAFRRCGAERPQ
jgi:hypothetical protein